MWGRLSRRGPAVALATAFVLFLSPTAVPRHVAGSWRAAEFAAGSGNTLAAQTALRDLQLVSGWHLAIRADLIRLALANQDGSLALQLLETSPPPHTPAPVLACWRAEARSLLGQWRQALDDLAHSDLHHCDRPPPLLRAIASSELAAQDLNAARDILQHLASLFPQDVETASLLGALLLITEPASAQPFVTFAASQGDALALDLAAITHDVPSDDPQAVLAKAGEVFLQHSQWPLAAATFHQLVRQQPGNAVAHAYLGLALDQLGRDGVEELQTAIRLDPGAAPAWMLLGLHWQSKDLPRRAIPFMQRAIDIEPANSAYLASLAAALSSAGDVQAALAQYRLAAEVSPTDPLFWRLLAAYSISQDLEVAETGLPAARNSAALRPDDAMTLDLAGYAHHLLGNNVTAERLLAHAVALDPASAPTRLHYGLVLSTLSRSDEARAHLTAAVTLAGETATGQFAQRALAQLGE